MKYLKTILAAGALAAAAFATTAADAATVVIHKNHGRVVETIHRAPVRVAIRTPILVGGWYAERANFHPYAFYRGNPRLRACFQVTKRGFEGRHPALISATMCYGKNGTSFIVPGSRHTVRFL